MVSPAVQGQVPHPSIVPQFLRSISCGMTSARGHGAIVYYLNSGSKERRKKRDVKRPGRENGQKVGRGGREESGGENGRRGERREEKTGETEKRAESGNWRKKDDERRWR
ncbi:hypothetical protein TNCV_3695441 [Trichonephila clavipes]|nr:hypothetical protein TNCV_3695441 [Trichonephila clavipes]